MGDVVRRLVARTVARQLGPSVEAATAPYQYVLSTRARSECIAHVIQGLTELNPEATVLSIDGNKRARPNFTCSNDGWTVQFVWR